jgi:hypothetical protein
LLGLHSGAADRVRAGLTADMRQMNPQFHN